MSVWNGHFDSKGNPCISIEVFGTNSSPLALDATIDTGFSGFLMMPMLPAMPLGMQQIGTTTANLADGTKIAIPLMDGTLRFAGRSEKGPVLVPGNTKVALVGLDFLRKFKLALVITSQQIALLDEADMQTLATSSRARLQEQGPVYED